MKPRSATRNGRAGKSGALSEVDIHINKLMRRKVNTGALQAKSTKEALPDVDKHYRILADLTSDYAYCLRVETDGNMVMEWMTDSVTRMLGWTEEDIQKGGWQLATLEEDLPAASEAFKKLMQGEEIKAEGRMRAKNGDIFWIWCHQVPEWNADRTRVVRIFGACKDITEQKRALEKLAKEEQRYKSLILATSQIIWSATADGRVVEDLPTWRAFTGQTREEIMNRGWMDAIHPEDLPLALQSFEESLLSKNASSTTFRARAKNGDFRTLLAQAIPLLDEKGDVQEWVGACRDITEERRAERNLHDFFENGIMCLHWVDANGVIINANRAELEYLGYEKEEYVGHHIAEFHTSQEIIKDILQRLMAGEVIRNYRAFLRHKNGSTKEVLIDSSVLWENGKFIHTRCFTRDITERKLLAEEAQQSRNHLKTIVEKITDGITIQGMQGKLVYANESAARMTGFASAEEFLRADVQEIMKRFELMNEHGESIASKDLPNRRALLGETVEPTLVRFRVLATGETRWSMLQVTPLFDPDGKPQGILNIFHDLTEQKRNEERAKFIAEASTALTQSLDYNTTLQSVAELLVPRLADWCTIVLSMPDGAYKTVAVAHKDPSKIQWALELQQKYPPSGPNPKAERGLPYVMRTGKAELYAEMTDEILMASAKDEEHLRMLKEIGMVSAMMVPVVAQDRTLGVINFLTAESHCHYTEDDLTFAVDLGKRIGLALDNARLFTELQETEKEIRQGNEELETRVLSRTKELEETRERDRANLERMKVMLEHLPMGALATDADGTVIHVNRQFCLCSGITLSPAEIIGKPALGVTSQILDHVVNHEEFERQQRYIQERRGPLIGAEIRLDDGRVLEFDYIPIFVDGSMRGQLSLYQDVTVEKRIDAAKTEFMSLASHQLRTPLTGIRWAFGKLERSLSSRVNELERQLLYEGKGAATRMADTIDTMLSISRVQAGNVQMEANQVDLREFLTKLGEELAQVCLQKNIHFHVECEDIHAQTDPKILREIVGNLLSNAMKYTPDHGTVILRATNGADIRIEVEDTGLGIPERQQKKVFQKFFRADNIVMRDTTGSGLGLYLVSLLVSILKGSITFRSTEGKGTTFVLTLPRILEP